MLGILQKLNLFALSLSRRRHCTQDVWESLSDIEEKTWSPSRIGAHHQCGARQIQAHFLQGVIMIVSQDQLLCAMKAVGEDTSFASLVIYVLFLQELVQGQCLAHVIQVFCLASSSFKGCVKLSHQLLC